MWRECVGKVWRKDVEKGVKRRCGGCLSPVCLLTYPLPPSHSGMLAAYVPSLEERKQLFEAVAYECQVGEESVDGHCVTKVCAAGVQSWPPRAAS